MNDSTVRHGKLRAQLGEPVRRDQWSIAGAIVDLEGDSFSTDFYLRDHVANPPPVVLARWITERLDAIWVRARIPSAFGFHPSSPEIEKSLLDVGFVAVQTEGREVAFPFLCTDYSGRTGLAFGSPGPEDGVKSSIASAFWEILLSDPESFTDFKERVFHPGAGVWMHFECSYGDLSYEESEDQA